MNINLHLGLENYFQILDANIKYEGDHIPYFVAFPILF